MNTSGILFNIFVIIGFFYVLLMSYGVIEIVDKAKKEKFEKKKTLLRVFGFIGIVLTLIQLSAKLF